MHRSRIGVVLIDHPEESAAAATTFWSGVLGGPSVSAQGPSEEDPYLELPSLPGGVGLEVQRTGSGTAPRVHLDIETDDVPAEVARVVALGAEVLEDRTGYAILRDPGGLVFCVVPVQREQEFAEQAVTWE
ncbi:VOC family protein [Ornithinicoccus hortensis]|uniref:Glyoxalase-like domain-containing protein n=1 Tax=Ornithinicoccus hortensis TaxID=82346 RepID=A0A542YP14_9MICO|nr:VOC family protein [Ornithinicoccus hortensis]TQL49801.1 hypothetical protein FB467_0894 [Ornithinicoccus hortensis]